MIEPSTFRWTGFTSKIGDIPESVSEDFSEIAMQKFAIPANDLEVASKVANAKSVREADEYVTKLMNRARSEAKVEAMVSFLAPYGINPSPEDQASWSKLREWMLANKVYIEEKGRGEYRVSFNGVAIQ